MSSDDRSAAGVEVRVLARNLLVQVEHGGRSDRVLDRALGASRLDDRDRRLVTEIVYGVLRRQQSLDRALAPFCSRPIERLDPGVRAALRIVGYQILFLRSIPAHAAVSTMVAATPRRARGLVNAVARAWLRAGGEVPATDDMATTYDVPGWLAGRWQQRYGEQAAPWFAAAATPPPVALRVHPHRSTVAEAIEALAAEGVEAVPSRWARDAIRVQRGNPLRTQLFRAGGLSPRGEAGQLIVRLLQPGGDGLVLDGCCGRGGKSVQLAEREGVRRVIAVDTDTDALRACRRAAARARTPQVVAIAGDLAEGPPLRARFDRVLVDVPCSGLGTMRRHPEIRWRIQPADLDRRAEAQRKILARTLRLLAPGGELLYVTCSTEPEENENVVDAVVDDVPGVLRVPIEASGPAAALVGSDGALRTFPSVPDLDGFFAVLLRRDRG